MDWIVKALAFGLPGLAAIFGFFVAAKIKTEGRGPSKAGERLINRYMVFCIVLLLLSGFMAAFDEYFIQGSQRLGKIREKAASLDSYLIGKLNVESGALACLPEPVRDQLEPIIYSMCSLVKGVAKEANGQPPTCVSEPPAQRPPPLPC
jgi:hypothetical protein